MRFIAIVHTAYFTLWRMNERACLLLLDKTHIRHSCGVRIVTRMTDARVRTIFVPLWHNILIYPKNTQHREKMRFVVILSVE